MNSLTNLDAAEKIIYLDSQEYNDQYADRVTPGFGITEVKKHLNKLFEERYPSIDEKTEE